MNNYNFFILFYIFCGLQNVHSQPFLLLPTQDVSWRTYLKYCNKAGFYCVDQFWEKNYHPPEAFYFNKLVDSFDSNTSLRDSQFLKQMIHVLNNETLSVDQLEMLVALLKQARMEHHIIYQDLQLSLSIISHFSIQKQTEDFYIFFNKKLSVSAKRKLQQLKLKFPVYYYHYNQMPKKISNHSLDYFNFQYLLEKKNSCRFVARFSYQGPWKVLQPVSCSDTQYKRRSEKRKRVARSIRAEHF